MKCPLALPTAAITVALASALGSCVAVAAVPARAAEPSNSPGNHASHAPPPAGSDDLDPFRDDAGLSVAHNGPDADGPDDIVRLMRFPVIGEVEYEDTFGACRGDDCSRRHMGNDIFAPKLRPLVAAQTGRITWLRTDASGTAGNGVGITDAEGWRYLYLHLNNDTPGTDDGANPDKWRFTPGVRLGSMVEAGQVVGYLGDSGNAETTPPHLHFELRTPEGETINPYPSLRVADTG